MGAGGEGSYNPFSVQIFSLVCKKKFLAFGSFSLFFSFSCLTDCKRVSLSVCKLLRILSKYSVLMCTFYLLALTLARFSLSFSLLCCSSLQIYTCSTRSASFCEPTRLRSFIRNNSLTSKLFFLCLYVYEIRFGSSSPSFACLSSFESFLSFSLALSLSFTYTLFTRSAGFFRAVISYLASKEAFY